MNILKLTSLFAVLIALFTLGSCTESSTTPTNQPWKAEHVIFIGLDGWGSYSVEKADMPNVKQLMSKGSYTLQKRSVLPSSSAVNWASMFMGAGPELHGYTTWGSQTPDLPSRELKESMMQFDVAPTIAEIFNLEGPQVWIGRSMSQVFQ